MTEPADWERIAAEAGEQGFGVPNSAAGADDVPPTPPPDPEPNPRRSRARRTRTGTQDGAGPKTREKPRPSTPPYREGMFVQPLTELYGFAAMAVIPFDAVCGTAIASSAESCAVALDKMAKTNPAARRMLLAITQSSALGAVIAAHLPIIMAVLLHHVPAAQNLMGQLGVRLAEGMARAAQERAEAEYQGQEGAPRAA